MTTRAVCRILAKLGAWALTRKGFKGHGTGKGKEQCSGSGSGKKHKYQVQSRNRRLRPRVPVNFNTESRIPHCEGWIYQQKRSRSLDIPGRYIGLPNIIQSGSYGIGTLCEAGLIRA